MSGNSELTGYELSRQWFSFVWENHLVTANHTSLYLFLCQLWNQLGQPANFKITAMECMRGMSANSYNTYKKSLDFLVDNGCIMVVQKSSNQFTCNVIALLKFDKAPDKAFNGAVYGASIKALDTSHETFIKPKTLNNKPQTNLLFERLWNVYPKKKSKGNAEKWFQKNKPSEELVSEMISAIGRLKESDQWQKEGGQFIPYPATWLNAEGWKDEVENKNSESLEERTQRLKRESMGATA